jgi:hypothetical protein
LAWFERLIALAAELMASGAPVVLAGDYNVVPTSHDIYPTQSLDNNALPKFDEVKSLSPNHRFVIALHSPGGVDETGLPECLSEKKEGKLARERQQSIFSGPV